MACGSNCSCLVRESRLLRPKSTFWTVFSIILVLMTMAPSGVTQIPHDFVSINCGGTSYMDPDTKIEWSDDDRFLDSIKQLAERNVTIRVIVNLDDAKAANRDNSNLMKTAMAFIPGRISMSKYCYKFDVQLGTSYLVRAMFPNSNMTISSEDPQKGNVLLSDYDTRFYFTVDSTLISTIDLDPVETRTIELVVTPLDRTMYICLVPPVEHKTTMPAISSLELRLLPLELYLDGRESTVIGSGSGIGDTVHKNRSALGTTYLMTISRLNFGGQILSPAIRFPIDPHDRLWYPAVDNFSDVNSKNTSFDGFEITGNYDYPVEVVQSAWEGSTMSSNISFTIDISSVNFAGDFSSFYISMTFYDVNPRDNGNRMVDIYLKEDGTEFLWGDEVPVLNSSLWIWCNPKQKFSVDNPIFRITKSQNSTLPAMINAFELFGEFKAEAGTSKDDVSTLQHIVHMIQNQTDIFLDTTGDPCRPVPWSWLSCGLEVPYRITLVTLRKLGLPGELSPEIARLDRLTELDLSYNNFHGGLQQSLLSVTTLRKLDVSNSNLDGSIPENIGQLKELRDLDMSFNSLSGALHVSLVKLPQLKNMSLQQNQLTGSVPDEIWSQSHLQTVNLKDNHFQELNLSTWCDTVEKENDINAVNLKVDLTNNRIEKIILPCRAKLQEAPVPVGSWFQESNGFILLGGNKYCESFDEGDLVNRYLCRRNEFENFWLAQNNGVNKTILTFAVPSGVVILLLVCTLLVLLRRSWKRIKQIHEIQEDLAREDVRPPFFKYDDLKAGTREFCEENQLGKGAFGAVYKAVLEDKSVVAVKLLYPTEQNTADFLREMVLITGIKHRHLIQLKGCCVRDKKRFLVYEFAENKNLAEALWGNETSQKLTWPQRLKICVGIARGLCYLHEELQPRIIHRDIKPHNILLNKDWDAKIADFGLARPMEKDSSEFATRIGGTLGYFSPEYAIQGKLTEKLDVYSFGILVLEIVSGRRCIDLSLNRNPGQVYLKDWAFKLYSEGKIMDLAEKEVLATGSEEEILSALKTAFLCLQENHEKRPSMSQVVIMLSGNSNSPEELLAVDIFSQLRDTHRMLDGLFDSSTFNESNNNLQGDKHTLLHSSLLHSTSSSYPQTDIEPSLSSNTVGRSSEY